MADFVKYNGYFVKDANALAHASISGKTLTTTDRKGRTVDTLTLPGGEFSSPIYKNSNEDPLVQALAVVSTETDIGNEIRSLDFWGSVTSTVVDWDPDKPAIQMDGTIYGDTIHAWQNFAASDEQYGVSSYQTAYKRQIRPKTYRATATYTREEGFTIAAGSTYLIGYLPTDMTVQTPDFRTIGTAVPVSVRPVLGSVYAAPVVLEMNNGQIIAYNTSATSVYISGFTVEFDIILFDLFTIEFLGDENTTTPFIEGVDANILTDSATGTKTVETKVIVKNKSTNATCTLDEYELQKQNDGTWGWIQTSTQTIPTSSLMTYYNEIFTFQHPLGARNDDTTKKFSGAVWYRVSTSGLAISTSDVVILPRRRAVS